MKLQWITLTLVSIAIQLIISNASALDFGCDSIVSVENNSLWTSTFTNCIEKPSLVIYNNTNITVQNVQNITNCTASDVEWLFKTYFTNYSYVIQDNFNYSRMWIDCRTSREVCIRENSDLSSGYNELNKSCTQVLHSWDYNISRTINRTREENRQLVADKDNEGWTRAGLVALGIMGIWAMTKVKLPKRTERAPISQQSITPDIKAIDRDAELAQSRADREEFRKIAKEWEEIRKKQNGG